MIKNTFYKVSKEMGNVKDYNYNYIVTDTTTESIIAFCHDKQDATLIKRALNHYSLKLAKKVPKC